MDELGKLSRSLDRKRRRLRDLLHDRHVTEFWHVNVRMATIYDTTRMIEMAIKKAKTDAPKKAEFVGFYNYEMTVEAKAECKAWIRNEIEVSLAIENAIASGYSVKVNLDGRKDAYQATMQCNNPSDKNAGLCMSAYAKHWYDAIAVLMFKHEMCLGRVWTDKEPTPLDEDFS
jgi:hypothetical protein